MSDPREHEQDPGPQDPVEASARSEPPQAAVNLSALLDDKGALVGEPEPDQGRGAGEPAENLPAGQPAEALNLPAGQPAGLDLPAGQPMVQLPLIPLAEVLGTALSHERLRREAREAWDVTRYFLARAITAAEPSLPVEHVVALFEAAKPEVPAELRGDAVRAVLWRLERAIVRARQAPPEAPKAAAQPAPVPGGAFWQMLAISYPELLAALRGPAAGATQDALEGSVRDLHERQAVRRVLTAALEDFEAHAAAVYRGPQSTWRTGILAALDAALARAFVVGLWLGQLGLGRVSRPAAGGPGERPHGGRTHDG